MMRKPEGRAEDRGVFTMAFTISGVSTALRTAKK
jgi:hypothetical protein